MYMGKTEGRSPKDIINYGKLKNLFTNSRDSNINPKEVLKYQINFKSYLSEIKKIKSKIKNIKSINVIRNVHNVFDLIEKIIDFFQRLVFFAKAKYKAIDREGLKILPPKQMPQRLPIALA